MGGFLESRLLEDMDINLKLELFTLRAPPAFIKDHHLEIPYPDRTLKTITNLYVGQWYP
jgi:hypothetical protein